MPELERPVLVAAFSGWPDAAEVGSGALAYLIRTLGAKRFATLDPEPFYVFGESRPTTLVIGGGERALTWPASEFFAARDPSGRDLVLFLAREPNVRWHEYLQAVLDLAERLQVGPLVSLGGTYDRVSHRGAATVSGWSPTPELRHSLASLGVRFTNYEGPSSIQAALMEACTRRGIAGASLWGHAPHYVSGIANPKVAHTVLLRLVELLGLQVDLDALAVAGRDMEAQIEQVLLGRQDLSDYVLGLQMHPYETPETSGQDALPSTQSIVEDLEAFLRQLESDDDD